MEYESFKHKILKLSELASRGSEGEAENAKRAIDRLCKAMGVALEDILNEDQKEKVYTFKVGSDPLLKNLFFRCLYKINKTEGEFREHGCNISLALTPFQYAELYTLFSWHKSNFKRELKEMRENLEMAYALKHNLSIQNDGEQQEEEVNERDIIQIRKVLSMVDNLSDVSFIKYLDS